MMIIMEVEKTGLKGYVVVFLHSFMHFKSLSKGYDATYLYLLNRFEAAAGAPPCRHHAAAMPPHVDA